MKVKDLIRILSVVDGGKEVLTKEGAIIGVEECPTHFSLLCVEKPPIDNLEVIGK